MSDYISRDAAINAVKSNRAEQTAIEALKNVPAADVGPVAHAEWMPVDECMYFCSRCFALGCGTPFCATCGATMGVKDE